LNRATGIKMDKGVKCIKFLLFGFNLIFAIAGLALIVTGGVIQGLYSQYLDFLGDSFFNTPVLLVVVGCIIFCVTFFGCCGAVKESHCMTMTFAILLGLIFVIELGAGISAYMLRTRVHGIVETNMEKGLLNYKVEGSEGVTQTWDIIQHELKCCGAQDYTDWRNSTTMQDTNSVPDSCCIEDTENCGKGLADPEKSIQDVSDKIHTTGCLDKFQEMVVKNVASVGAMGVIIALIQIVGVVFACCLSKNIRAQYETV